MTQFVTLCKTAELQPGQREVFGVNGRWIAVFNVDGRYYGIADLCTHDDGPLAEGDLDGFEIKCPRHGARFDIRNGRVLSPPALVDTIWYELRVEGDELQVALP